MAVIKRFSVCLHINCLVTLKPKHFHLRTPCCFELGLIGSGLGVMIFHKMSPRTHLNYLQPNHFSGGCNFCEVIIEVCIGDTLLSLAF